MRLIVCVCVCVCVNPPPFSCFEEPPPDDVKDEGSKVVNDEVSNVVKDEGSKVIWEWEGDKGKWTSYDQPHAVEITKALTGGEDTVTLQVAPTVKLNIALSSMTQTNVATGWQRNVRCHSSGCGQWEWQNEQGVWNIYSPGLQRLFVACAECGVSEREIECGGRSYKLDLVAKKQINVETKVERKIRVTGVIEGEWLFSRVGFHSDLVNNYALFNCVIVLFLEVKCPPAFHILVALETSHQREGE